MPLFQNIYRVESARLQNWDYGCNAPYFVTICTKNKEHYFGEIINGEMSFSDLGNIACQFWNEIPNHFPFVLLDAWTVMPNHVHGIIVINKSIEEMGLRVESQNIIQQPAGNRFGPQSQNLGSIIRGFKIAVTKYAQQNNLGFGWQPRFHDHVIRNDESYLKIRNYILTNPQRWSEDTFNNAAK